MNKVLHRRLNKLSPTKPNQAYVIYVPPNRTDELNQKEAKELLRAGGYPANSNPWIIAFENVVEAQVIVIEDFKALMEEASGGKRIGDR